MAILTANMQVLELSSLQVLSYEGPTDAAQLARRFLTLVASPAAEEARGGSGCVSKVANCQGESFALKSMLPVREDDPQERYRIQAARRQAFFEEYEAHLAVSGVPGIPLLYGLGLLSGEPVMLMDWVEGQTLSGAKDLLPQVSGERGTTGRVVASIGLAVARVLLMARGHAPGFVHRDVSARNIMLRGTPEMIRQQLDELDVSVCLIDMGSSHVPQANRTSITMGADVWRYGTPEYAAPEMLVREDDIITQRRSYSIDVYALCSVLYELYAGYAPYNMRANATRLEMSAHDMKSQFGPIALALHDEADRPLAELILAGIVAEQDERITLEELYDGLHAYLGVAGMSAAQLIERGFQVGRPVPGQLDVLDTQAGGCRITGPLPEWLTAAMSMPPGRIRRQIRDFFSQ